MGRRSWGARVATLAGVAALSSLALPSVAAAELTASAGGEWFDLADEFVKGDRAYSLDVCWTLDAVENVSEIGVDGDGDSLWTRRFSGTTDECTEAAQVVEGTFLSEGAHEFRTWVDGTNGSHVESAPWTVYVDRTPPGVPTGLRAVLDPATGVATLAWDNADDPALADGTPASPALTYEYTLQRASGTTTGVVNEPAVGVDGSAVGEQLTLSVHAVDAAGNVGATTSATVAVVAPPTDTQAPTLSLASAMARYSAAENVTVVDWAPAEDPDLSDGAPSAGIAGYDVTYSLDGAAAVTASTEDSRLVLPGGHAGQGIALTVVPRDVAGNNGTTRTATLSAQAWTADLSTDTLACAPSEDGFPAACSNGLSDDEVEAGPEATLEPAESSSAFGRLDAGSLQRLYIRVKGNWTTARLRPGSWVTGNVRDGWTLDRVGADVNGYKFGTIRGPFKACGWILSELLSAPYANDGDSNCAQAAQPTEQPALASIALASNNKKNDGSPIRLRQDLTHSVRFCAYLVPAPTTIQTRHDCGGTYKMVSAAAANDGYNVLWRYVIRGRQWVLVRDRHKTGSGTINWWFVPRSAFGVICDRNVFGNACPPRP